MGAVLLLVLVFYSCIGLGLAIASLAVPSARRTIHNMAEQANMTLSYAHAIWFVGTFLVWPIGLNVLSTGRLLLIGYASQQTASGETLSAEESAARSVSPLPRMSAR